MTEKITVDQVVFSTPGKDSMKDSRIVATSCELSLEDRREIEINAQIRDIIPSNYDFIEGRRMFPLPSGTICLSKTINLYDYSGRPNTLYSHIFLLSPKKYLRLANPIFFERYYKFYEPIPSGHIPQMEISDEDGTLAASQYSSIKLADILSQVVGAYIEGKKVLIIAEDGNTSHNILYLLYAHLPYPIRMMPFSTHSISDRYEEKFFLIFIPESIATGAYNENEYVVLRFRESSKESAEAKVNIIPEYIAFAVKNPSHVNYFYYESYRKKIPVSQYSDFFEYWQKRETLESSGKWEDYLKLNRLATEFEHERADEFIIKAWKSGMPRTADNAEILLKELDYQRDWMENVSQDLPESAIFELMYKDNTFKNYYVSLHTGTKGESFNIVQKALNYNFPTRWIYTDLYKKAASMLPVSKSLNLLYKIYSNEKFSGFDQVTVGMYLKDLLQLLDLFYDSMGEKEITRGDWYFENMKYGLNRLKMVDAFPWDSKSLSDLLSLFSKLWYDEREIVWRFLSPIALPVLLKKENSKLLGKEVESVIVRIFNTQKRTPIDYKRIQFMSKKLDYYGEERIKRRLDSIYNDWIRENERLRKDKAKRTKKEQKLTEKRIKEERKKAEKSMEQYSQPYDPGIKNKKSFLKGKKR